MKCTFLNDPDMPISEVMKRWPQTIRVFLHYNMKCTGCMVNPFHTILNACQEYGLCPEQFELELIQVTDGKT